MPRLDTKKHCIFSSFVGMLPGCSQNVCAADHEPRSAMIPKKRSSRSNFPSVIPNRLYCHVWFSSMVFLALCRTFQFNILFGGGFIAPVSLPSHHGYLSVARTDVLLKDLHLCVIRVPKRAWYCLGHLSSEYLCNDSLYTTLSLPLCRCMYMLEHSANNAKKIGLNPTH